MKTILDYDFWYSLTQYANEIWKGYFSEEEMRENAQVYLDEWEYSIKTKELSYTISKCLENLLEDKACNIEEAIDFITKIKKEIKRHQIKEVD
ncbi:MAG: hypothetical protein VZS44_10110 [Bacilli bacterium]|nr:hypothetical protein [Bacilli bacterium]